MVTLILLLILAICAIIYLFANVGIYILMFADVIVCIVIIIAISKIFKAIKNVFKKKKGGKHE